MLAASSSYVRSSFHPLLSTVVRSKWGPALQILQLFLTNWWNTIKNTRKLHPWLFILSNIAINLVKEDDTNSPKESFHLCVMSCWTRIGHDTNIRLTHIGHVTNTTNMLELADVSPYQLMLGTTDKNTDAKHTLRHQNNIH